VEETAGTMENVTNDRKRNRETSARDGCSFLEVKSLFLLPFMTKPPFYAAISAPGVNKVFSRQPRLAGV
jgi:hypothetical protein